MEIKVDARADSFSVKAEYENGRGRGGDKNWKVYKKLEVEFRLMVPRTAILDEIETVNGSVAVSNFTNYTKISAVNGNVKASNLRGTANMETVNGTVEADFDRLESGSKISLNTVNGRVNLMIPSDSNATIKADTVNGSISNDFGLPVRKGEYVGKDLYGRVGSGEARIRLNSVNGGLSINRRNDGKTLSSPTNLLNEKNRDEDDWNNSSMDAPRINSAKMNKDIAKSVKDSQKALKDSEKEIADALKIAEEELKNIEPVINEAAIESLKNAELNSQEIKEALKQAEIARKDAMAQLAEIRFTNAAPRIEKKSETFNVKGMQKVTIDAKNCNVSVRGWDKAEVMYVVKKFSLDRSQTAVESKARQTDSEVNITVGNRRITPQNEDVYEGETNVRIEVYVPKKSNLRIISDGEIRLENISGEINLDGDDEAINIRDVDGNLRLTAVDARVRIIGFRGELNAKTNDGDVYLEGNFTKISARATDGTYTLTLPEAANAIFNSNTEIESEGFNLIKDGAQTWRVGKGGENFNFSFADGRLIVRNQNALGEK